MNSAGIRVMRIFRVVLLGYGAMLVILELAARGYVPVSTLVVLAFMLSVAALHTHVIRRQRRIDAIRNRPRPDYASIAAMEREIYGQAFEHDGAPKAVRTVSGPHGLPPTKPPAGPPPRPGKTQACWHCGTPGTRVSGLCADCYRMLKDWRIQPQRPTCPQGHPDRRWVEGYGEMCPTCDSKRRARACDCDEDERRSNLRWN